MQIAVLAEEQREGRHFDVVQQCALLMAFSHEDKRVTHLVRKRAQHVRECALQILNLTDEASLSSAASTGDGATTKQDPLSSTAESGSMSSTNKGGASSSSTPRHLDLLSDRQTPNKNSETPGSRGSQNIKARPYSEPPALCKCSSEYYAEAKCFSFSCFYFFFPRKNIGEAQRNEEQDPTHPDWPSLPLPWPINLYFLFPNRSCTYCIHESVVIVFTT